MRTLWMRRLREDKGGAALIEFTLVLPILLLLAFGTIEFGRILQHNHVVNKAVRDSGRFLARVQVNCPAGGGSGAFVNGGDVTRARNLTMYGVPAPNESTPRLLPYWTDTSTVTIQPPQCIDNSSRAFRGRSEIPVVTVSAAVPYQDLGFLSFLGVDAVVLNARHQQLSIGE